MELGAHHVAALDDRDEALAVLAAARRRRPGPPAGRRTCARGRRPPRRRARRSARPAARTSPCSSRCAGSSARAPPAASRRRRAGRGPSAPSCSVEESNSSCMPRQMPSSGTPASARSRSSVVELERAQAAHRLRERAHAGHHDRVGGARSRARRRCAPTVAPTCSSAFSTLRRLPMP